MSEQASTQKKSKPVRCLVTSAKMDRSRIGTIERLVMHKDYGKFMRRRTKLMFHDETNESNLGDTVLVVQTRPMSARKRFKLVKVVEKAKQ